MTKQKEKYVLVYVDVVGNEKIIVSILSKFVKDGCVFVCPPNEHVVKYAKEHDIRCATIEKLDDQSLSAYVDMLSYGIFVVEGISNMVLKFIDKYPKLVLFIARP